ncbi:hypothetical protein HDU91_001169, partial [Kappamyces sp. JEL0680]
MSERSPIADEALIKVIRLILADKNALDRRDVQGSTPIRKSSSVEMLKEYFSPSSPIQPPTSPSISMLSLSTKQMLQFLQSLAAMEPSLFYDKVAAVLHGRPSEPLLKEFVLYRNSLPREWIWDVGLSNDALLHWKDAEQEWAKGFIAAQPTASGYASFIAAAAASTPIYLLSILDAVGLKPKDSPTSNNSYATVTYLGSTWTGPIAHRTLNPLFDFSFPLFVNPASLEKITIALWNRCTVKNPQEFRKDLFLGCMQLSAADVERMATNNQMLDVPLQKRTSRSHVSGNLRIVASLLQSPPIAPSAVYAKGFYLIPSDVKQHYRQLCKACYEWDYVKTSESKAKAALSAISQDLLGRLGVVWRIRPVFQSLCAFEVVYSLFSQGYIGIETIYSHFLDAFNKISDVDGPTGAELLLFSNLSQGLVTALNQLLRTFFNRDRTKGFSGKSLDGVLVMISAVYSSPALQTSPDKIDIIAHVRSLLVESLTARYNELLGAARQVDPEQQYPLAILATSIKDELDMYQKDFELMVF